MSVRRRVWFTGVQKRQIEPGARELAAADGKPDEWGNFEYLKSAADPLGMEPNEAWIVNYTDGAGKRHIETFARKKDADAFAAKVKVDVNAGTHVAIDNDLTVAGVAAKWIRGVEADGRERGTILQYTQHANTHIIPRIGAVKLAKLTRERVEHFRDGLLAGDKALSRPMARKVFVSFKSMLKVVHCSHLAANVRIGTGKREKRDLQPNKDFPTPAEVKRLIDAAKDKPKLEALLKVAALAGLRASELLGLRWADVDFKRQELHVRQRADRFRAIGPTKSGKSRTVPLGDDLILTLKTWKLACPKGELDLVFPTIIGTVTNYQNLMGKLGPIMVRAGVVKKSGKPKYALHALRHFFASWCINPKDRGGRELPAKVVQEWLGHSSINMTLDIYGHLFPHKADRAEITASERALLG